MNILACQIASEIELAWIARSFNFAQSQII